MIEILEDRLMKHTLTKVDETLQRFFIYSQEYYVPERTYDRIVRLHKDMLDEKVFVYKYEDAMRLMKAAEKVMNAEA
jgi:hypothetical protein